MVDMREMWANKMVKNLSINKRKHVKKNVVQRLRIERVICACQTKYLYSTFCFFILFTRFPSEPRLCWRRWRGGGQRWAFQKGIRLCVECDSTVYPVPFGIVPPFTPRCAPFHSLLLSLGNEFSERLCPNSSSSFTSHAVFLYHILTYARELHYAVQMKWKQQHDSINISVDVSAFANTKYMLVKSCSTGVEYQMCFVSFLFLIVL